MINFCNQNPSDSVEINVKFLISFVNPCFVENIWTNFSIQCVNIETNGEKGPVIPVLSGWLYIQSSELEIVESMIHWFTIALLMISRQQNWKYYRGVAEGAERGEVRIVWRSLLSSLFLFIKSLTFSTFLVI